MFRYVALAWNVEDAGQCAAARLLKETLQSRAELWGQESERSGLCVLHQNFRQGSLDICTLPNQGGVVLGAMFHRLRDRTDDSTAPRFIPCQQQSEQIVASRGRWLIHHVWGNYVAVLRDAVSIRRWVLKDPAGTLPCFRTHFRGVHVIFGDVADLVATKLFRFTIDADYLKNRVLHGGVLDQQALTEVESVYRGECVELSDERCEKQRVFYWNPLTFVDSSEVIEDASYAIQAIRATVRSCTRTLCADHQSVLHRLSGGLDSSIIAACLADVPNHPWLNCYTYYVPGGRSDERPWARLAASQHGLKHEEHPTIPSAIPLPMAADMPPLVEPTAIMGYLLRSTLEQDLTQQHQATAVLCGDGGDSGFCADTFAYAASEFLQRHGLHPQALRLAAHVAALTEESTWTVMMKSLRRWHRGAGMEHQRTLVMSVSRLLSDELRASYVHTRAFPHPWLNQLQPIPWPLVRRLGSLLAPPEFYNVAAGVDAPEVIAPLYSQPATELFLRIPVDMHFYRGRERGLARQAFARDVPSEILRRSWKDRVPGFIDQLVDKHRKFLRELLLDGVLVAERLLNRAAVEEALSERISKSPIYPGELLRHLDVEIWARRWRQLATVDALSRVPA